MDDRVSKVEALAVAKGKILPGMLADFIVLSDDILSISSQNLLSLRVEQTYVGGNLVYDEYSAVRK